jgi:dimethylamine/trimethylamine dehydrogenase
MVLGKRGYEVALAEAGTDPWRARRPRTPAARPSAWGRVADYRVGQIAPMANVTPYFDSALTAEDVLDFGFQHVAIATGALWRRDVVARHHLAPDPDRGPCPSSPPTT